MTKEKPNEMDIEKENGKTRVGEIKLEIPKLRKGSFYPSLLEPRKRF